MAQRRFPWASLTIGTLLIAAAPAAWQWIDSVNMRQTDAVVGETPATRLLPSAALQLLSNQEFFARIGELAPRRTASHAKITDDVGGAPDLKRVFDDHIGSADPRQRRTAVRAFEACVPAFVPAPGQSPSPEPLIAALPFEHRAERAAAYRSLFARCQGLVAGGRGPVESKLETVRDDPQSQALGLVAQEAALAGRLDIVEPLVNEALNAADPAAVASLAGLATRIAQMRVSDGADAAVMRHAHEVDAALPLVACDLGLDCSAQSLWALQLCAAEALCQGDVSARLLARDATGGVDPRAVREQRQRLLSLVRTGRTLGTGDLLAP